MTAPPPLDREPRSVRHPWEPADRFEHLRRTDPEAWRRAVQLDRDSALHEPLAGLALSERERAVLTWLSGWGVPTVAPVVRLLWAARMAAPLDEPDDGPDDGGAR